MDVRSKIEDLTRKKAALEEKMSRLEPLDSRDVPWEQISRERKVLLRQLCDVKIRLKNLRFLLKEKTPAVANHFLSQEEKDKSQMMKKIDIKESEINQDETEAVNEDSRENEVDGSDSSLDETFYTACESRASDSDWDETENEEEVGECNQIRPILALQPLLELQKSKLVPHLEEEIKKGWLGEEKEEQEKQGEKHGRRRGKWGGREGKG